jgi:hypothetical protein
MHPALKHWIQGLSGDWCALPSMDIDTEYEEKFRIFATPNHRGGEQLTSGQGELQ